MRPHFALVSIVALFACASPPKAAVESPPVTPTQIAAGEAMAQRYCATCHAIGRAGDSPNPAAPPFRRLAERYPVNALEEAFAEGVLVGHPAMPEFQLSPAQIDDLVGYLETIQERRGG